MQETLEASEVADQLEEKRVAMVVTGRVELAIEIAMEAMTIVILVEEIEIAVTGIVMVVAVVAVVVVVVSAMHGKKVTVQGVHHAGSPTKMEAEVGVAVRAVAGCVMTIKVGDVIGEILVDSHMKMMAVAVVDEGITVVDALRETETAVEVDVEEAGNRSVVTVYQAMETGVPLVQKSVSGKMEYFTKDVGATASLVRFLVDVQLRDHNLVLDLEIGECLCLKALADPLPVTIRKRFRNPYRNPKLQRHLQKLLKKPCFRLAEDFRQPWQELRL